MTRILAAIAIPAYGYWIWRAVDLLWVPEPIFASIVVMTMIGSALRAFTHALSGARPTPPGDA